MTPDEIRRWRLHALLLGAPRAATPVEVLTRLRVVQGQDFLPALWSLAQRSAVVPSYDEVGAAFDRGEILRTHVLRPTWHLVSPEVVGWLLTATASRVHLRNGTHYRRYGVDEELMTAVRTRLETVLPGRALTRTEFQDSLAEVGIAADGLRLVSVLMWAELEGWIVSGPRSGKQQTYALLAERVPHRESVDREEAVARLAEVYLRTRGPATVRDLAAWASLTLTEARAAATAVPGVTSVRVQHRDYLVLGDPPADAGPTGHVDLVQQYDEIAMSYLESRDLLTGPIGDARRKPTTYVHAILVDGALVGHWRYDRDAHGRPHRVQTFGYHPLDEATLRGVRAQLERFGSFTGASVQAT